MELLRKSLQLRAFAITLGFVVLFAKLFTPYLHTHNEADHLHSYLASACSACDIESTQSIESVTPVVLPEQRISQILPAIKLASALASFETRTNKHLRGPPVVS